MYCYVCIVLLILFLNILLWSIYYVQPQPDHYIIKINIYIQQYSNNPHVCICMYILSLIIIYTNLSSISIHTCIHTHAYIHMCIHSHRGSYIQGGLIYIRSLFIYLSRRSYLGGSFIVFLYYPNFFKKGLSNFRFLEYSINIRNNQFIDLLGLLYRLSKNIPTLKNRYN